MTSHPRSSSVTAVVLALLAVVLTGCGPAGSGVIVDETREVGSFDRIAVSRGIDVALTVDATAGETTVVVVYDDNLQDQIVTEVEGTELQVRSRGSFNVTGAGRQVEIVTPTLVGLSVSGGSDVTGSGVIEALSVTASGGSDVDLTDLVAAVVNAEASGGADLRVNVTEEITAVASGGAELVILGDPPSQNVESSGGADVVNE
jgi:hypothetical protein